MYDQQRNKKKRRNTQEKFRRRKISLISKVDDLHRLFGVDVFFVIQKNGRYYGYISVVNPYWPPNKEQIVSPFANLRRDYLTSYQERSYPRPDMKTPADFDEIKGKEKTK